MDEPDLSAKAAAGDAAAQLRLAERLAGDGRSVEALDWLAKSARNGEPQALGQLGLRLLTGDGAPHRPAQAIGLLDDAARRGHAASAALLSVLAGGGFHAPQSWPAALDYLLRAAELGWAPAQAQLRILAGDSGAAEDRAGPDPWGRLRRAVDLQAWTSAPPVRVLNEAPLIGVVEALASPEACAWIISQSQGRLVRAEVYDAETGRTIMGETRTNRVANFGLAETSLLNLLIQARISAATCAPLQMMEAFAVLNYAVGEEATEHFDYLDPSVPSYRSQIEQLGQRVATCLVYLNEGYSGGETAFPELGLSHKGKTGDALFFFSVDRDGAPDPRTVHAGRPPTSGEKWLLSQFIRNQPRVGVEARRA